MQEQNNQVQAVINVLTEYGITEEAARSLIDDVGITCAEDLGMVKEGELTKVGMTRIQARKLRAVYNPDKKAASGASNNAPDSPDKPPQLLDYRSVLSAPPPEDVWLTNIIKGGELKIDEFSIMSAIRALVARQAGLYEAPAKLLGAINDYADKMDEPAAPPYFRVRTTIYQMAHPEIFGLLKENYEFVPREDKDELLSRIQEFVPSLKLCFEAVDNWQTTLATAYGGQGAVIAAFNGMAGSDNIVIPSFDAVHDATMALKDAVNHAFRGRGIQTAKALATDAEDIIGLLDDPEIPPLIGTASREQMLKKLDICISPNFARQEKSFAMFAQNLIAFSNGAAEGNEFKFLMALWMLGRELSWKLLDSKTAGGSPNSKLWKMACAPDEKIPDIEFDNEKGFVPATEKPKDSAKESAEKSANAAQGATEDAAFPFEGGSATGRAEPEEKPAGETSAASAATADQSKDSSSSSVSKSSSTQPEFSAITREIKSYSRRDWL